MILGALMSALERAEKSRDEAVEALIERTKQQGLSGQGAASCWGDVYEAMQSQEGRNNGRR